VNLIAHKFRGPLNRDLEGPFVMPGDFSTPSEQYFAHVDQVIRIADRKGIQIFLAPIYLDTGGPMRAGTKKPCLTVLRSAAPGDVCRQTLQFRQHHLAGGDRNPDKALGDVTAVVAGIKENDQRHLFSAHCDPEHSAVEEYGPSGWLNLNTTYSYEIVHKKLLADYNRTPFMPFVLIQSTYEGGTTLAALSRSAGRLTGRCYAARLASSWGTCRSGTSTPAGRRLCMRKALWT